MLEASLERAGQRRIGVEHEMAVPLVGSGTGADVQRTIAQVLSANELCAVYRGYSHQPLSQGVDLAVECDSSVRGQSEWQGVTWYPIEMKTRILTGIDEWERIVPKALQISSYMGARINRTCGHHVHLSFDEAKDDARNIRSLFNLFLRYEKVIYGLVAPSRRENGYSRALPFEPDLFKGCRSLSRFWRKIQGSTLVRQNGLNLTHLHGANPRIEFRYHAGTLNPGKARYWLRFLLQMVSHAVTRSCHTPREQIANDRKGIERLLISCGFKPNSGIYTKVCPELRETGRWLLRRWKALNPDESHALRSKKPVKSRTAGSADLERHDRRGREDLHDHDRWRRFLLRNGAVSVTG